VVIEFRGGYRGFISTYIVFTGDYRGFRGGYRGV